MFKRKEDKHNVRFFKKLVSTVFTNGGLVNVDANGYLTPADATSVDHVGIILRDVKTTDDDYATAIVYVMVDACSPNDLLTASVSAGTVAQTAVGAYYDLDSTGAQVDLSATSVKAVYVQDINTATGEVVVQINSMAGVNESGT